MKNIFTFLLLTSFSLTSFSQGNGETFNGINKCLNKKFTVSIHIILDTLGQQNVTKEEIQLGIDKVNAAFGKICASFDVCSTYVHPNSRNNIIVKAGPKATELTTLYDVPNTINIYYVKEIIGVTTVCGYAPLGSTKAPARTPGRDAIFMQKKCASDATLIHEIGHYFGLYHTFETNTNGTELVNGSNCSTAGDLVCDTPADPGSPHVTDGHCDVDPATTDSNGDYHTPNACNHMSYYLNACKNQFFTTGQYNRMLEIIETGRKYLW